MSFTRFNYDLARVEKKLQESTDPGKYILNVPGPGDNTKFIESPFVRLQKFGNNLRTDPINIESDLIGLTRNTNRDNININNYKNKQVHSNSINFNEDKSIWTEQSRVSHPAWMYKDKQQFEPKYLFFDPQENICMPFQNNLSSRILEKDYFNGKGFSTNF